MANFVLVPGFWLGGWAWDEVAGLLRKDGHDVYPLTLTGLGERVHLGSAETDLDTHIADVVNAIAYNELEDVYLVGHSYAGIVVTCVADRIPKKIAKIIYVDTAPLPDGVAHTDFYEPDELAAYEKKVAEKGDGWLLPLPSKKELSDGNNLDGVDQKAWERMENLATAQPFNASRQKVVLNNPARSHLPKLGIFCTYTIADAKELIASGAPIFKELADPKFEFEELATGHWPMFSRPADLARILISAVV